MKRKTKIKKDQQQKILNHVVREWIDGRLSSRVSGFAHASSDTRPNTEEISLHFILEALVGA